MHTITVIRIRSIYWSKQVCHSRYQIKIIFPKFTINQPPLSLHLVLRNSLEHSFSELEQSKRILFIELQNCIGYFVRHQAKKHPQFQKHVRSPIFLTNSLNPEFVTIQKKLITLKKQISKKKR